jgi:phytoene desaturase
VDAAAFDTYGDWLRHLHVAEMPTETSTRHSGLLSSPRALAQLLRLGAFRRLGAVVGNGLPIRNCIGALQLSGMYAGPAADRPLRSNAVITYMDTVKGVCSGGRHPPGPDDDRAHR